MQGCCVQAGQQVVTLFPPELQGVHAVESAKGGRELLGLGPVRCASQAVARMR